jgi:hypothetical protein
MSLPHPPLSRIETDRHGHIIMSPLPLLVTLDGRLESPLSSSACSLTACLSPNAPFRLPTASRQPTLPGSGNSVRRSTRNPSFSLAHRKSASRSFRHLTHQPRSTKNVRSISTPAPRESGFATSTVRSLFFLIQMMMLLLLLFARRSQTGFLKGRLHRFGHGPAELSRRGYGDRGKCD